MAFNDVIKEDGPGVVVCVDVSFDDFATVSYRYSTVSFTPSGGLPYEARIVDGGAGKLTRGFGREGTPQPGQLQLLLDNTDFGLDWLITQAGVESYVMRARFKVTLVVYPAGNVAGYQTKVLGTFKVFNFPRADASSVAVELVDDTMGRFADLLTSPTLREWRDDAGSTVDNCPLHADLNPVPAVDWDVPLPLAWGEQWLNCFGAAATGDDQAVGDLAFCRAIPVCATTASAAVSADDVKYLRGVYGTDVVLGTNKWSGAGSIVSIPKTFQLPGTGGALLTLWEPLKTQTLTKDGASWKILWVSFNVFNYSEWYKHTFPDSRIGGESDSPVNYVAPQAPTAGQWRQDLERTFAAFAYFQAYGSPYSARTSTGLAQYGVHVIQDLVSYYSRGSATDVDTTLFAAAVAASQVPVAGVVQPQRTVSSRFNYSGVAPATDVLAMTPLRQLLSDICQSIDVDLFMTWAGKFGVIPAASYFTFDNYTATRLTIDETRCANVVVRTPSKGERWAPYNRVWVLAPDGNAHGPFDNATAITAWGAIHERILDGKWLYPFSPVNPLYAETIWHSYRKLESKVRQVISFTTDREAFQLELGDLFNFTWSRGGAGSLYSGAVFRVDSMSIDLETLTIAIEAVWVDEIRTEYAYLLDNEDLLVAYTSGGVLGDAIVEDGSNVIEFSTGDPAGDGIVAEGDIIRLLDATAAPNDFRRYRELLVIACGSTNITVDDDDLDFGAPTPVSVVDYEIRRGFRTYPDSSSDPTNYPSDGLVYGKACSDADEFSTDTNINRLL